MSVEFENNSIRCKAEINEATIAWLHEAAGEIEAETKRNSAVGKVSGSKTKNAWKYVVDESEGVATVGNPEENAIWEEFGTGEYALEGNGRKGGWYIPIGNGAGEISQAVVDAYHMKVVYGKNGMKFAYTEGKKPKRMLQRAYDSKRKKLEKRLETLLKGLN